MIMNLLSCTQKGGSALYTVEFYRDKDGYSEVEEYLKELNEKANDNKDSRINFDTIIRYIRALSIYGTRIGEPKVKHLEGDLWELRPLNNRIFFFYWKDNKFVLLSHFKKKSQKTPKREKEKAKRNMSDWKERKS